MVKRENSWSREIVLAAALSAGALGGMTGLMSGLYEKTVTAEKQQMQDRGKPPNRSDKDAVTRNSCIEKEEDIPKFPLCEE